LLQSGWHPLGTLAPADPRREVVHQAWFLLQWRIGEVPRLLQPWMNQRWLLQPCLCDPWHDHVLFEGERVTGLIDYGAVKVDNVAVDLARLLGSLVPDDAERWQIGLEAYRRVRKLSLEEESLARVLDVTAVVLGVATWLRWLFEIKRDFGDPQAAIQRLGVLVKRMACWE
jgi:Ser/Thr protein kinase RdoA (MazF antagonist)